MLIVAVLYSTLRVALRSAGAQTLMLDRSALIKLCRPRIQRSNSQGKLRISEISKELLEIVTGPMSRTRECIITGHWMLFSRSKIMLQEMPTAACSS